MAATVQHAPPASAKTKSRRPRGPFHWIRMHIVQIAAGLALIYMFLPVMVVVVFSFNNPVGRYNYQWNEFSTEAWTNLCGVAGMCESLTLSLEIAVIATLFATLLGTLVAFALGRYRFRGRAGTNLLIFMPMATPEVVMGASLLTLFLNMRFPLGFGTILIAHIMFLISFVVVTVKARVAGLDPRLEQAAADLYSNESSTFWRITFPLALPGIISGAMLAFALSFDDFIITNFNAGSEVTFPMFVYGAAQRGVPPQVNVVGSLMFLIALSIVLGGQLVKRRRAR